MTLGEHPVSALTSATTDELWEELCARHDSLLMIGMLRMGDHESGQSVYWRGPHPTLIGLAEIAKERLLHEHLCEAEEDS